MFCNEASMTTFEYEAGTKRQNCREIAVARNV